MAAVLICLSSVRGHADTLTDETSTALTPARLERQIARLNADLGVAFWLADTMPGEDTNRLAATVEDRFTTLYADGIAALAGTDQSQWRDEDRRKFSLLRHRTDRPLPPTPTERDELSRAIAELRRGLAATALCLPDGPFLDRIGVEDFLRGNSEPDTRLSVWLGWHEQLDTQRELFGQVTNLLNRAARKWGYRGINEWRDSRFEKDSTEVAADAERLWIELIPLYRSLHCHVRHRLEGGHGGSAPERTIPAYMIGALDPRDWEALEAPARADLPESVDLSADVAARFSSSEEAAHIAAAFYGTMGYPPLPETVWQRSLFDRTPVERGCDRSGWNVDWNRDVRVSTCDDNNEENFRWLHWIFAHLHYDIAFSPLDWSYRDPPHPGFHEAHANAALLSLTPIYLRGLGVIAELPDAEHETARLLRQALRTLPGLMVNVAAHTWRIGVTAPTGQETNANWWRALERYAGISAPARAGFGALALSEIARNQDLLAEFFGTIISYQILAAACADATVPLHQCSMAGDKEFGARLYEMLSTGASRPWPDALRIATGSSEVSAAPLIRYYSPLQEWLDRQNASRNCGW
jgi:peptidyl-dipeptidase A